MNRFTVRSTSSLLLGLLLLTASCKKDTGGVTPDPGTSGSPAFVGPHWQMSAFTLDPAVDFDGDGKVDADLLPFMPACERDDTIEFSASGKIKASPGQLQCADQSDNSQKKPDSWTYNSASKTITLTDGDNPGDVSTWDVLEASSTVLTVKTTVIEDGKPLKATIRWKAI